MSNTRLFSFGKSLFFGALPEDVIFPYPRLSRQEQERTAKLLTQLSELSREAIDPRQIDEQEQIPAVVLQRLAALVPRRWLHLIRLHGVLAPNAKLLKRVFEIDMEHCPNCGGELKIITAILEAPVIERILMHLGLQARAPPRAPARGQALQAA